MNKVTVHHIIANIKSKTITSKTLCNAVLPVAMSLLLSVVHISCADDAEEYGVKMDVPTVRVGIELTTRASKSTAEGYEAGSGYENYIDVARGDFRIYFFDGDDKYIATFEPGSFALTDEDGYTSYSLLGEVSQAITDNASHFKVVILANCGGNYVEDTDLIQGVTSISDICEPYNTGSQNLGIFDHKTDFRLGPDNLLPFYGVREYKDKHFESGKATFLYGEPITLLRAMAKVEVILQLDDVRDDDTTFSDVRICNYNDRGYCAPNGVTSQGEYNYGEWSVDYVRKLHLVNAANDGDYKEKQFLKVQERSADNTIKEKWIAYLPEYDNSGDDYSYIEVKLQEKGKENGPYKIYFADYMGGYSEDVPSNRYDIQRNSLYRFKVRLKDGSLDVTVNGWENVWENDFEFGTIIGDEDE
ncbi:MAG: FimB/Mfa2 family fimbrial subunit [Prevotella sp.]|nr:FimB/Mfa2 family fimbrial subunit [Prevotella sp.]